MNDSPPSTERDRRQFLERTVALATALVPTIAGCSELVSGPPDRADTTTPTPGRPTPEPESATPAPTETAESTEARNEQSADGYPGYEALPDPLAVDASNPFIYLNDQSTDNYMGELALAMAGSGVVDLRSFLLGYPREVWKRPEKYQRHREEFVTNHRLMRRIAAESGMENLPPAELGVFDQHDKPESGAIDETEVIGSVGTDRIVREARRASPEKPVVVAVGGDVCTVADAYLQDPSIADSLVVYWHEQVNDINEQSGYNIQNSGWSAYVVLSRLAVVLDQNSGGYTITTEQVRNRIPSPLDEYMTTKEHWKWGNPLASTDWSDAGEDGPGDERALLLAAYPYTRNGANPFEVSGLQRAEWPYKQKRVLPTVAPGDSASKLIEIPNITRSGRAFWESWGWDVSTSSPVQ